MRRLPGSCPLSGLSFSLYYFRSRPTACVCKPECIPVFRPSSTRSQSESSRILSMTQRSDVIQQRHRRTSSIALRKSSLQLVAFDQFCERLRRKSLAGRSRGSASRTDENKLWSRFRQGAYRQSKSPGHLFSADCRPQPAARRRQHPERIASPWRRPTEDRGAVHPVPLLPWRKDTTTQPSKCNPSSV